MLTANTAGSLAVFPITIAVLGDQNIAKIADFLMDEKNERNRGRDHLGSADLISKKLSLSLLSLIFSENALKPDKSSPTCQLGFPHGGEVRIEK